MSIMNNVANLFRPVQATQQVANPSTQANQAPSGAAEPLAQHNPAASPDGIKQEMANQAAENLPLDNFKDLWQTPTNQAAPADPWSSPLVNLNPADISARVKNVNFTQGIDPQKVQAALGGDANSFMEVINSATQRAFEMSLQVNAATTNAAGNTIGDRVKEYMPRAYKDQQLREAPVSNSALEHPAFQPMLQATRQQIARNNPQLSTAQVNAKAEEYFSSAFSAYQGGTPEAKTAAQTPSLPNANDFSAW